MKSKNLSENILRSVKSKGFKYIDLPSVIEANHIVQRSGENFRKFIFSFIDQNGSELCLRPDLTIASCLRYLENNLKGKEKIFYSGQAYRKSQNKKDSIIRNQIGFEILGSKNEKINFLKFSPDLWTMWLASITEGKSIYLNPLDLTALRIFSDKFFDFIN